MLVAIHHDRQAALAAMASAYSDRLKLSAAQLEQALPDWQIVGLSISNETIGAFAVKDGECHIGIVPERRGQWGGVETLRWLFDEFPVSHTYVAPGNRRPMVLLERCGWRAVGTEQRGIRYER